MPQRIRTLVATLPYPQLAIAHRVGFVALLLAVSAPTACGDDATPAPPAAQTAGNGGNTAAGGGQAGASGAAGAAAGAGGSSGSKAGASGSAGGPGGAGGTGEGAGAGGVSGAAGSGVLAPYTQKRFLVPGKRLRGVSIGEKNEKIGGMDTELGLIDPENAVADEPSAVCVWERTSATEGRCVPSSALPVDNARFADAACTERAALAYVDDCGKAGPTERVGLVRPAQTAGACDTTSTYLSEIVALVAQPAGAKTYAKNAAGVCTEEPAAPLAATVYKVGASIPLTKYVAGSIVNESAFDGLIVQSWAGEDGSRQAFRTFVADDPTAEPGILTIGSGKAQLAAWVPGTNVTLDHTAPPGYFEDAACGSQLATATLGCPAGVKPTPFLLAYDLPAKGYCSLERRLYEVGAEVPVASVFEKTDTTCALAPASSAYRYFKRGPAVSQPAIKQAKLYEAYGTTLSRPALDDENMLLADRHRLPLPGSFDPAYRDRGPKLTGASCRFALGSGGKYRCYPTEAQALPVFYQDAACTQIIVDALADECASDLVVLPSSETCNTKRPYARPNGSGGVSTVYALEGGTCQVKTDPSFTGKVWRYMVELTDEDFVEGSIGVQ